MTTVVSNGNDALNLLFEAAQREERDLNSGRGAGVDPVSPIVTMSPTSPAMSTRIDLLPELSPELLETWNAYRFVRMGWLAAEEVVWLVDMYVCAFQLCEDRGLINHTGSSRICHLSRLY